MSKTSCERPRPSRNQSISCLRETDLPSAGCCTGEIVRWLADRNFDDAERQLVRKLRRQQRHGHVVDRHVALRPSLERAAVRVAVENGIDAVAVDRLLETRRAEERVDLRRLALDRALER